MKTNQELWHNCEAWAVQAVTDPIIWERMKTDEKYSLEKWKEIRERQIEFYRMKSTP